MKFKTVKLDFSQITTETQLHSILAEKLGFPSFYGANTHALIDCLSSLRYPEDQMTKLVLANSELLLFELNNFFYAPQEVWQNFLVAIDSVNSRCLKKNTEPTIYLMLGSS